MLHISEFRNWIRTRLTKLNRPDLAKQLLGEDKPMPANTWRKKGKEAMAKEEVKKEFKSDFPSSKTKGENVNNGWKGKGGKKYFSLINEELNSLKLCYKDSIIYFGP
jgi:hypothetical protein